MVQERAGSGSAATASIQQTQEVIRQHSLNPTDYLNFFRDVCHMAKQAGVREQQLLDNISSWYNEGGTGTGTTSGGGESNR